MEDRKIPTGVKPAVKKPAWQLRLEKQKEDGLKYNKSLFLGRPKVGKTTLAGSYPNPITFDFDDGMESLNEADREFRIPDPLSDEAFINKTGTNNTERYVDEIMSIGMAIVNKESIFADDGPMPNRKTIIIDSWHEMSLNIFALACIDAKNENRSGKDDTMKAYGILKRESHRLGRFFRRVPLHVAATCGVRVVEDEENLTVSKEKRIAPLIDGAFRNVIPHIFDAVWLLDRKQNGQNIKYMAYTSLYQSAEDLGTRFKAKDGSQYPLKLDITNKTYDDIFVKNFWLEG